MKCLSRLLDKARDDGLVQIVCILESKILIPLELGVDGVGEHEQDGAKIVEFGPNLDCEGRCCTAQSKSLTPCAGR